MIATIADRARAAAAHLHTAQTAAPEHRSRATDRAIARLRVATLLGVCTTDITLEVDELRTTELNVALVLAATDPVDPGAVYRFSILDPHLQDDALDLLCPCPTCGGEVPIREVHTLVDLADTQQPHRQPGNDAAPAHPGFPDDLSATAPPARTPPEPHQLRTPGQREGVNPCAANQR